MIKMWFILKKNRKKCQTSLILAPTEENGPLMFSYFLNTILAPAIRNYDIGRQARTKITTDDLQNIPFAIELLSSRPAWSYPTRIGGPVAVHRKYFIPEILYFICRRKFWNRN